MRKILFGVFLCLAALAAPAHGQTASAIVVQSCGATQTPYQVGQSYPITMDIAGNICGSQAGAFGQLLGVAGFGQAGTKPCPADAGVCNLLALIERTNGDLSSQLTALNYIKTELVSVAFKPFNYSHITTDTTTVLKTSGGILHTLCVNTVGAGSTITVDDALSATTPTIAVLSGATLGCYTYDVGFNIGLTIVTATTTPDVTVSWR